MDQKLVDDIVKKHGKWLRDEEGGERWVCKINEDLRDADLQGANLQGADLDYSAWPLWCGSKNVIIDVRIAALLAGHGAVVKVDLSKATDEETKLVTEWQAACLALGKLGHRANDLGLV